MKTELLHPRHRRAGAELSGGDAPLVLCFGEVPDEYRAAREGAALFDRTRREALAVSGPDAAGFLHRLLANAVRTLAPGQGNRNLLLSSKGKVLFDFDLAVGADSIHLSLPPGSAAPLAKALDMYQFSEKLTVQDVSDAHAPLELCGPRAAELVARIAAVEAPRELHTHVDARFEGAPLRVTALPVAGSFGWRLDAGPALAETAAPAPAAVSEAQTEHDKLFALFADADARELALNPLNRLFRGDDTNADTLGDFLTDTAFLAARTDTQLNLALLAQIDRAMSPH